MAISGGFRFRVTGEDGFPNGCVMGADPVVPVTDFEKKGKGDDQERDKHNPDLRVWAVRVHDLDESLMGKSRELVVKIYAIHQPVPPVCEVMTAVARLAAVVRDLRRAEGRIASAAAAGRSGTRLIPVIARGGHVLSRPVPGQARTVPQHTVTRSGRDEHDRD